MKSISILSFWLFAMLGTALAQSGGITVLQMPREGFWKVGLMNHSAKEVSGILVVSLRQGNRVLRTPQRFPLRLTSGGNLIDLLSPQGGDGLGHELVSLGSASQLAPDEICLELFVEGSLAFSQCEIMQQGAIMPPHLVYPFDEDQLESALPMLSWTPPAPVSNPASLRYRLRLVEIVGYHSPISAMANMPAIVEQQDIRQNVMPYSPVYRELEPGHTYAWQVEAYDGGRFLGRSELWTFQIKDTKKEEQVDSSPFVQLRKRMDSGFYPAQGKVRFRFDCRYGETQLNFKIVNQRGETLAISPKNLEKVGKNLFELRLPVGSGLIEQEFYQLVVTNNKRESSYLKFQYSYPQL